MNIAVLSGKGGVGKTFVSVNLAAVDKNSIYIDCDVEEPNGYLFFKPEGIITKDVQVEVPLVDKDLCNGCRKCVDFCKFNALAYANDKLIIFEDICHSCGGCILFCPQKALSEKKKSIGKIERGKSGDVTVLSGTLNIGEASGVPIIKALLNEDLARGENHIIDCPPGSSCSVMESIEDADYCLLVAEATIFGVHNLKMVYELVKLFKIPLAVVINKCLDGENIAEDFCIEHNIKILEKIPFDIELGDLNSNGLIASRENDKYRSLFKDLLEKITKEVKDEAIINS